MALLAASALPAAAREASVDAVDAVVEARAALSAAVDADVEALADADAARLALSAAVLLADPHASIGGMGREGGAADTDCAAVPAT